MSEQGGAVDERIDQALIESARGGDDSALETLLQRHESGVLRLVRLLGVSPTDREDVAQEIFVRLFRHLHTFKLGRSFRGWLYRIAVNVVHDHRLRMAKRFHREAPWSDGLEALPDEAAGPGEWADAAQQRERLELALDGLSERERAVFVLVELSGLDRREAARSLGITSITVRRHLSRARSSLQKILADDEKK